MPQQYFGYFYNRDYDFGNGVVKRVTDISKYTAIFEKLSNDYTYYTYYTMQPGQRYDDISFELYGTPNYYWTIPLVNGFITNTWKDSPRTVVDLERYIQMKYPGRAFLLRDDQSLAGKFQIGENLNLENLDAEVLAAATIIGVFPTLGYIQATINEGFTFEENVELSLIGSTTRNQVIINNHVPMRDAPAYFTEASTGDRVRFSVSPSVPTTIFEQESDRNDIISQIKVIRQEYIGQIENLFEQEMRRRRSS